MRRLNHFRDFRFQAMQIALVQTLSEFTYEFVGATDRRCSACRYHLHNQSFVGRLHLYLIRSNRIFDSGSNRSVQALIVAKRRSVALRT